MTGKGMIEWLRGQDIQISLCPLILPQAKLGPKLRARLNANIHPLMMALCEEYLEGAKHGEKEGVEKPKDKGK